MLYSLGLASAVSVVGDILPMLIAFAALALATTFID
jgi:hypothetical protein